MPLRARLALVIMLALLATTGSRAGAAVPVEQPQPVSNLTPPTVTGKAEVGRVLTASPGDWSPSSGLTYDYRWLRDGIVVRDALTATYTLTATDVGRTFAVSVTATAGDGIFSSATSAPTAPVVPGHVRGTKPYLVVTSRWGVPVVGDRVRVDVGHWGPAGVQLRVRWFRDCRPIRGATGRHYRVVRADVGHDLGVVVKGTAPGYTSQSRTAIPSERVRAHPATTEPHDKPVSCR